MDRIHIHSALSQVREMKQRMMDHQFRGYSGRARAVGGTVALASTAIMASPAYPKFNFPHELGWGMVIFALLCINYGALFYWFFTDKAVGRDIRRLKPAIDTVPAVIVGMMITIALSRDGMHQYLFGTWLCLYGLVNMSLRQTLSDSVWPLGMYYILWGSLCLLVFNVDFLNPWPMGLVLFFGEWWGGLVFHLNRNPGSSVAEFLAIKQGEEVRHGG